MKWKQFPSQVLVSLNNQKKLSSLWKPRLSDPFLPYLLPVTTPSSLPLELTGPLEDDIVADQYDTALNCTVHYNIIVVHSGLKVTRSFQHEIC